MKSNATRASWTGLMPDVVYIITQNVCVVLGSIHTCGLSKCDKSWNEIASDWKRIDPPVGGVSSFWLADMQRRREKTAFIVFLQNIYANQSCAALEMDAANWLWKTKMDDDGRKKEKAQSSVPLFVYIFEQGWVSACADLQTPPLWREEICAAESSVS